MFQLVTKMLIINYGYYKLLFFSYSIPFNDISQGLHIDPFHIPRDGYLFTLSILTASSRLFIPQVVLLGKFNGQGLGHNQELLVRCTKGQEYVKVTVIMKPMCCADEI